MNGVLMLSASQRGSVELRVLRALLSRAGSRLDLDAHLHNPMSHESYGRAVKDAANVLNGFRLEHVVHSRKRHSDETVHTAVDFMLSERYACRISWGAKDVVVDDPDTGGRKFVALPKVIRRQLPTTIYDMYKDSGDPDSVKLGRTTFLELVNVLTHQNNVVLSAVDYVVSRLVNDTFDAVTLLIAELLPDDRTRRTQLLAEATAARNFLKNNYTDHLKIMDDGCATHNWKHALGQTAADQPSRDGVQCAGCLYRHCFLKSIRELIAEKSTGATLQERLVGIDAVADKWNLYEAHLARKVCQEDAIDAQLEASKAACTAETPKGRLCVIVFDWKMKALPRNVRGSSQAWYGQSGTSWHGACVWWYEFDCDTGQPVQKRWYFHQLVEGTKKQGGLAVLAMADTIFAKIKHELPHLSQMAVQSDNAKCYHLAEYVLLLPIVAARHGLVLTSNSHSAVQNGKGDLDQNFGVLSKAIDRHMTTTADPDVKTGVVRNDASTPAEIWFCLANGGTLTQASVSLVTVDEAQLQRCAEAVADCAAVVRRHTGNGMEIRYTLTTTANLVGCDLAALDDAGVVLKAEFYKHSGDLSPAVLELNVSEGHGRVLKENSPVDGCADSYEDDHEGHVQQASQTTDQCSAGEAAAGEDADFGVDGDVFTGAHNRLHYRAPESTRRYKAKAAVAGKAVVNKWSNEREPNVVRKPRQDVLSRAVAYVVSGEADKATDGHSIVDGKAPLPAHPNSLAAAALKDLVCKRRRNWAHIDEHVGPKYGPSLAYRFEPRISELFYASEDGPESKGKRLGKDAIAAIIRQENPARTLLCPSAADVQVVLLKLGARKKAQLARGQPVQPGLAGSASLPFAVKQEIRRLLTTDRDGNMLKNCLKNVYAWAARVQAKCACPKASLLKAGFCCESKVRNCINNARVTLKPLQGVVAAVALAAAKPAKPAAPKRPFGKGPQHPAGGKVSKKPKCEPGPVDVGGGRLHRVKQPAVADANPAEPAPGAGTTKEADVLQDYRANINDSVDVTVASLVDWVTKRTSRRPRPNLAFNHVGNYNFTNGRLTKEDVCKLLVVGEVVVTRLQKPKELEDGRPARVVTVQARYVSGFVSDPVVNMALDAMRHTFDKAGLAHAHVANTFLVTTKVQPNGSKKVGCTPSNLLNYGKKWWGKKGKTLFGRRYVVVPYNESNLHWWTMVVDLELGLFIPVDSIVLSEDDEGWQEKRAAQEAVADALRNWLEKHRANLAKSEGIAADREHLPSDESALAKFQLWWPHVRQVPQQRGNDCALHAVLNAIAFLRGVVDLHEGDAMPHAEPLIHNAAGRRNFLYLLLSGHFVKEHWLR